MKIINILKLYHAYIPVFCQFLLDQPTLSKHRMVYHRTRLHPTLSNEWEDDQPSSRCVPAAPSEVTPSTVLFTTRFSKSRIKFGKTKRN